MVSIYTYVDGLTKKPTKLVFGVRIGVHYVVPGLVDATGKVTKEKIFSYCHPKFSLKAIRDSKQPFCVLKSKILGGNHIEA